MRKTTVASGRFAEIETEVVPEVAVETKAQEQQEIPVTVPQKQEVAFVSTDNNDPDDAFDPSFDPSEWRKLEQANLENTGAGERRIARVAIAQSNTPMVSRKEPGWESGMLYDSMSKEIISIKGYAPWLLAKGLTEQQIKSEEFFCPFVPIMKLPTEWALWPTQEERKAGRRIFHWKSFDLTDPRVIAGSWPPIGRFMDTTIAPPVTEHLNILGFALDMHGEPKGGLIIETFSRTSFKTGKKLANACINNGMVNQPYWGFIHYLYTKMVQEDSNTYYIQQTAKGPTLEKFCGGSKELFRTCYMIAKSLADDKEKQRALLDEATFDTDNSAEEGEIIDHGMNADDEHPEF